MIESWTWQFLFCTSRIPCSAQRGWRPGEAEPQKLKNGEFDIRSFYNALRGFTYVIFPWKGIWGMKVPLRVSFFFFFQIAVWGKDSHENIRTGAICVSVMGRRWTTF